MFDPTVFDNLKVVVEGQIYDLDLAKKIRIIKRKDQVELATMSREYAIDFQLFNSERVTAQIILIAETEDLAAEIMEIPDRMPGCILYICFNTWLTDPKNQCEYIHRQLESVWGQDQDLRQTISYDFKSGNIP